MNPIDNYRQSEFAAQTAKDALAAKHGVVTAVVAALFIAADLVLLVRLLAAY